MAKYRDEVELLLSARNEQVQALRQADGQARALAQRQDAEGRKQARRAQELADTEAQILDRSLRHAGRVLDADLQKIRRHYRLKIRAAIAANDQELAARLRTLRDIRQAEARAADASRRQQAQQKSSDSGPLGTLVTLAVLHTVTRATDELTKSLIESRDAGLGIAESTNKVLRDMIRTIPVAGQVLSIGEQIRELFTSERAELERINQLIEQRERNMKVARDNAAEEAQVTRGRLREQRDLEQRIAVLRADPAKR